MNRFHRIRRSLALLAGLAGALLASAAAASAAYATPLPPPGGSDGSSAPAPVQVITAGGMPGWQIALIAAGTAVLAAAVAVSLDRARTARRHTLSPAT